MRRLLGVVWLVQLFIFQLGVDSFDLLGGAGAACRPQPHTADDRLALREVRKRSVTTCAFHILSRLSSVGATSGLSCNVCHGWCENYGARVTGYD